MNIAQPSHLIIIALVVLVLFGAQKIPQFMKGLGQGVGEFKKGMEEGKTPEAPAETPKTETK